MVKKITLTALLLSPMLATAEANINPLIQVGYDWGGTTLATVYNPYKGTTKIHAGEGINLEVGAIFSLPKNDLEMQLLVGYKVDQDNADNGKVTWDIIPFTALAMVNKKRWKFGGGVTYHLNPALSGSFSGYENNVYFNDSVDDKYENAIGGVVQVQYKATNAFSVGLKGTLIEYKLKSDSSVTAKGNSIGFNLSYAFGHQRSEFR
jgi:hypothetical protein